MKIFARRTTLEVKCIKTVILISHTYQLVLAFVVSLAILITIQYLKISYLNLVVNFRILGRIKLLKYCTN